MNRPIADDFSAIASALKEIEHKQPEPFPEERTGWALLTQVCHKCGWAYRIEIRPNWTASYCPHCTTRNAF